MGNAQYIKGNLQLKGVSGIRKVLPIANCQLVSKQLTSLSHCLVGGNHKQINF
jgi:hypothetical protein